MPWQGLNVPEVDELHLGESFVLAVDSESGTRGRLHLQRYGTKESGVQVRDEIDTSVTNRLGELDPVGEEKGAQERCPDKFDLL